MIAEIKKVSGRNITLKNEKGLTATLPAKYSNLIDIAVENLGFWFNVTVQKGQIVKLVKME